MAALAQNAVGVTPTFTVLIGSAGRPSLRHTLDSIARQARVPGDQVIVTFDSFEMSDEQLLRNLDIVASYGDDFHPYEYDSGYHWYGIEQINKALRDMPITGSHIFTLGDDDVFVDGAYDTLRPLCAAEPKRPILYKFLAPWREILWDVPTMQRSRISGCCIAAPREFVGEFPTRKYVEHDFDWMLAIIAASKVQPIWLDEVLVIARPDVRGDDVAHRGLRRCWHCRDFRYLEDVNRMEPYCPRCHAVFDLVPA